MRKITTRHPGTNCGTSSARFAPSFVRQPSGPECTQIVQNHQNISLGSNGVDRVRSLQKIPTRLHGTNFCTISGHFATSFVWQQNGPECTQIVRNAQNVSLESNGVDRVCSLQKILTRLCGTNFCTEFRKATKRSRMHPNILTRTKMSV